jgi:GntR family transcriptional repressor for pyruvate dehydrogenase complex
MTERELAETLNVSRNSVRDAINKLVTLRFLEHRQGQGTFVRPLTKPSKSPGNGHGNPGCEPHRPDGNAHGDRVQRGLAGGPAGIMRRTWKAIEKAITADGSRYRGPAVWALEGDLDFHMAIATATKNPMQIYLMKNVSDFLHVGIRKNLLHLYEIPENIVNILQQHNAIFKAIRKGDASTATRAMKNHIDFVIHFFKNRQEGAD